MLRPFKLEDANYIINSHYEIYNKEYNYDLSFKKFIDDSLHQFINESDKLKEKIWILEVDNKPKGSIGITKVNENIAQLRLFLVDPCLRGSGFGNDLLKEAINFCREVNYGKIILWTNSDLSAARYLYEKYGFELKESRIVTLSNQELTEELWELKLYIENTIK